MGSASHFYRKRRSSNVTILNIDNDASVDEIREVLLHATVYCGVPLAVDAFRAAQEVLKEVAASAD
ncbi:hypothetical protein C7W93_02800 [Glaciimonas sp. PCH181]|nr:hypothetical protein C7W93_02800 [Glaciimonas sp. PCH181]